jgi:hypothetical protein
MMITTPLDAVLVLGTIVAIPLIIILLSWIKSFLENRHE